MLNLAKHALVHRLPVHDCMFSGGNACCAVPQGQMDPMQTNMPFDDDQFRQFEDGLFDDDD